MVGVSIQNKNIKCTASNLTLALEHVLHILGKIRGQKFNGDPFLRVQRRDSEFDPLVIVAHLQLQQYHPLAFVHS